MSVRIGKPSAFGPAAFNPARMRSPSFNPGPRYAPTLVRLALSKLALNTNSPTAARMPRAMRSTCSSLSITHGPAISTRRLPKSANSIGTGELGSGEQRLLNGRLAPVALLFRRADEALEQRVRLHGLALELGMELAAQIPRMVGELADFDVRIVRRLARDLEARRLQALFVFAIELVAVVMGLVDFARAVGVVSDAALGQAASPASQPHGAAQLVDALEFAELEDDAVRRARIELGGIGGLQSAHVAREFDHQGLHAEADPEVRHLAFARELDGVEHAVDAALAEAAGHQDAVVIFQLPLPILASHAFGLDPIYVDLQLVRQAAMQQRFLEALIGVFVFTYLPTRAMETSPRGLSRRSSIAVHLARSRGPASSLSRRRTISSTPSAANPTGTAYTLLTSRAVITARTSTSQKRAIFSFISCGMKRSQRHSRISGWMPRARSSFTLCCVGLVLSSCAAAIHGTRVTWMNRQLSRPSSWRIWRMASRKGSDSISPTVPPISAITTSTSPDTFFSAALISLVTCGITCTVFPR